MGGMELEPGQGEGSCPCWRGLGVAGSRGRGREAVPCLGLAQHMFVGLP